MKKYKCYGDERSSGYIFKLKPNLEKKNYRLNNWNSYCELQKINPLLLSIGITNQGETIIVPLIPKKMEPKKNEMEVVFGDKSYIVKTKQTVTLSDEMLVLVKQTNVVTHRLVLKILAEKEPVKIGKRTVVSQSVNSYKNRLSTKDENRINYTKSRKKNETSQWSIDHPFSGGRMK